MTMTDTQRPGIVAYGPLYPYLMQQLEARSRISKPRVDPYHKNEKSKK